MFVIYLGVVGILTWRLGLFVGSTMSLVIAVWLPSYWLGAEASIETMGELSTQPVFLMIFAVTASIGSLIPKEKKKIRDAEHKLIKNALLDVRILRTALVISTVYYLTNISSGLLLPVFADGYSGGTIVAITKSNPVIYTIFGTIGLAYNMLGVFYSLKKRSLSCLAFAVAQKAFFMLPLILAPIAGLVFATNAGLLDYGTRIISEMILPLLIWFAADTSKLLQGLKRLRINKKLFFILLFLPICISVVLICLGIFEEIPSLLIAKIIGRADAYSLLDDNKLSELRGIFAGNLLYFFHAILKVFGQSAYSAPIGTTLLFGSDPGANVGGPNINLILTLSIICGSNAVTSIILPLAGLTFGFVSRKAVTRIKNSQFLDDETIMALFIFLTFPTLITEPSAWSHSLLFLLIIYTAYRLSPLAFGREQE